MTAEGNSMSTDTEKIRYLFEYVLRVLKSNAEMSAKISSELAAVSVAVSGLDPTFNDVLLEKRAEADEVSDPAIRANLHRYEEMIRRVQSGEFI
jgi:hypothetical protein